MRLTIKNTKESDACILRELARKCPPLDLHTPYTYWVVTKMFGKFSFLAFDKDKPIGYIMCIKNANCLLIWQIGILEEYRKKNISKDLIGKVFESISMDQCSSVIVSIAEENKNSYYAFLKFCEHHGYIMKEKSSVILKDMFDLSFFEKEILYEIKKDSNS